MNKDNKINKKGLLLGLAIGIIFSLATVSAAVYFNWVGTPHYEKSKEHAEKIKIGVNTLISDNDELKTKIDSLEAEGLESIEYYEERLEIMSKVIKELEKSVENRDQSILELQTQVLDRDAIIEELRTLIELDENQLNQALIDMQDIESDLYDIVQMLD